MANTAIPGLSALGLGFNPFDPSASEFGQTAFRGNLITFQGAGGTDYMAEKVPYQDNLSGVWTVPQGKAAIRCRGRAIKCLPTSP